MTEVPAVKALSSAEPGSRMLYSRLIGALFPLGFVVRGAYSLWEAVTASQKGPKLHRHHGQNEDFYVLEGAVEFVTGGDTVRVDEGGFVRVPSGTVHRYTVTSRQPCRMLVVLTPPGGVEEFWREIGIRVSDGSSPPPSPGSTNFHEIAAIARRHGMEFVVT
jgi:mannose-6-phosphate isomerase-like protein (cupin superfamily)